MSFALRIRPEAEADMSEASTWYEERGLGGEFIAGLERRLHQIEERPRMFPVVFRDVRCARMQRFPYAIFYILEPAGVVVLAVMHQARDPAAWQTRG
jgi:plasmid stabilization system protein ParE